MRQVQCVACNTHTRTYTHVYTINIDTTFSPPSSHPSNQRTNEANRQCRAAKPPSNHPAELPNCQSKSCWMTGCLPACPIARWVEWHAAGNSRLAAATTSQPAKLEIHSVRRWAVERDTVSGVVKITSTKFTGARLNELHRNFYYMF